MEIEDNDKMQFWQLDLAGMGKNNFGAGKEDSAIYYDVPYYLEAIQVL